MASRLKQLILLIADWALLYLALFFALVLRYQELPSALKWSNHWPVFSLVFFIWLVAFYLTGLYDLNRAKNNVAFFKSFLTVIAVNFLLGAGFFYIFSSSQISPKTILLLIVLTYLPCFTLGRLLVHRLLLASTLKNRLLFLGLRDEAIELVNSFENEPQLGYHTVGALAEPANPFWPSLPPSVERLESFDNLLNFIKEKKIDTVILALPASDHKLNHLLYQTIFMRVNIVEITSFYEMITHRVSLSALSEVWFLENLKESQKKIYDSFRQLIDYFSGFIMFVFLLIFILPISLLIYLYDQGPVFHRQTRVGKDGRIFSILKFRTMIPNAEAQGTQFTKPNDPRITAVGKFLRILHLDELPQSLNILKGNMSLTGPRPERPEFVAELEKIMPYYQTRHLVKPGLTGWAQINYKYTDSLAGNLIKLQYDLFYVKNRSLLIDLLILLKTVNIIVKRIGR